MTPARSNTPRRWPACLAVALLAGCAAPLPTTPQSAQTPPPRHAGDTQPAPTEGEVLARNARLLIYRPAAGETLRTIAARWLDDPGRDWEIAELNGVSSVAPDQPLVLPLQTVNAVGVRPGMVQTVPILSYHRFGPRGGRLTVSPSSFAQQLEWLARNDYRVVRLAQLEAFLQGRARLPPRAVVITIDDGYESAIRVALPLLRQYGFTATLFIVSDFIGVGDALTWGQLRELVDSGLIDIGAHSKTHRNLSLQVVDETDDDYRRQVELEVRAPREVLERRLGVVVRHFAFPYGDANAPVLENVAKQRYALAATVSAGGNPFFAEPLLLRRTMVFGDDDLSAFRAKLQTRRVFGPP